LDSAGSYAVPVFREQIANSKLITIKRVENGDIYERWLISIRMAADWAIKVGNQCSHGEIFGLDAGKIKPIRVDDLIKLIAKKYGITNITEWFDSHTKFIPGEIGEKNSYMPSSKNGDGEAIEDSIIKITITSDAVALDNLLNKMINLDQDSSDKEIEVFLSKILDEDGNLPKAK
jgi:FlaA1/EpsC-like NDP-sugar epimerase